MIKNQNLDLLRQKDTLLVKVGKILRDKIWANEYGRALYAIENNNFQNHKINTVIIDFSNCYWVDPIPYLSLLISLQAFVAFGGEGVFIYPSKKTGDKFLLRFLKFSSQEGFAYQALKNRIQINDANGNEITDSDIDDNNQITLDLAYINSTFLPAQIINLSKRQVSIRSLIDNSIQNAIGQFQQIPLWAQEDLQYRLYSFLVETLNNCKEHAYRKKSPVKFAGFYVRYRTGLKNVPQQARKEWKKNINFEAESCPPLKSFKDYLDHRDGCIEAFVVDAGIGIINSFRNAGFPIEKYGKYPFRNIIKKIFLDGLTTKSDKSVPSGGLHILHKLLEPNNDYIRGIDSKEWVGTSCPLVRQSSGFYELVNSKCLTKGLAWCARLSWRTKTDVGENWIRYKNGNETHPAIAALSSDISREHHIKYFSKSPVFDYRFDKKESPSKMEIFKTDCCLFFTKPGMVKWDIKATIENELGKKISFDRQWNLIIADIAPHEAETYVAAFVEPRWGKVEWLKYIKQVILISQHWSICILKKAEKKYNYFFNIDIGASEKYFSYKSLNVSPDKSIDDTVKWIKYFDSKVIWKAITEDSDQAIYLPGKIEWLSKPDGSKEFIDGYLDFSQILTLPLCYSLFRQAMRRIIGLFPGNAFRLESLDRLTKNLVEDFNSLKLTPQNQEYIVDKDKQKIMLGSVIVTGETQKLKDSTNNQTIHFFKHPSSSSSNPICLFLWPDNKWLKSFFSNRKGEPIKIEKYIRIGKTPFVAPGGRKYFSIPRYDDSNNLVAFRSPSQSYNDWQSLMPQIMRIGHWVYEAHHDLLTVNLQAATRHSFSTFGNLAKFIFIYFYRFLGVKENNLNELGEKWLRLAKDNINCQNNTSVNIIVFPSHPNTETVINEFLKCINKKSYKNIRNIIIPLLPFRRSHDGSTLLIAPLILEKIKKILKQSQQKNVLIFDDAIINGKTIKELKCILDNAGADKIYVLALLNRNRLPQGKKYTKSFNHYWRLDIPVLGGEKVCPFCRAQELIRNFIGSLASNRSKSRLRVWLNDWRPISTSSRWDEGMKGIHLEQEMIKKFSLKKGLGNQGYKAMDQICLSQSIGLSVYACELHSMTGLDDAAIRICEKEKQKNYKELPWAARVELFASQLLLFSEEYEHRLKYDLIERLLTAACESKKSDRWTSLACLTLIYIIGNDVTEVVNNALQLSDKQPSNLNWDVQILLANLLHRKLINNKKSKYDIAKRLLSVNVSNVSERYNHIHLETLDTFGNAHSRPLSKWACGKIFYDDRDKANAIAEVRDSIDKIADVLINLDMGMARSNTKNFKGRKEDILYKTQIAAKIFKDNTKIDESKSRTICSDIINELREFLDEYFFYKLNYSNLNRTRVFEDKEIPALFNKIDWKHVAKTKNLNHTPTIGKSINWQYYSDSNRNEIWVVWDGNIIQILRDLLMNSIHADRPISDPWVKVEEEECHDVWISVEYQSKSLVISIANHSTETAETVFRQIESRTNWSHLYELGGRIDHCQIDPHCIALHVVLPYAGLLGSTVTNGV